MTEHDMRKGTRNKWNYGDDTYESLLREMCDGGSYSDSEGNSYCTHCYETNSHAEDCSLARARKMLRL
jgi:hypothetical protein